MKYQSILQRGFHPLQQLAAFVIFLLLIQLVIWQKPSAEIAPSLAAWEASFTILLLFSVTNAILSIATKNMGQYWIFSLISYVSLAIIGGFLATQISGVTVDDAGQFRWLYMLFTFIFLIILTIAQTMRKIVEIAQKQDARLRGEE